MLKAIGFDLDDTLYPQIQYELYAFKRISMLIEKRYNVDSDRYFNEIVNLFTAQKKERIFDLAIRNTLNFVPEDWEFFVNRELLTEYRNSRPKLELYSWVLNFLSLLKKENKILVLITNGRVETQNYKIDSLGIRNYFSHIYISDEYTPPARKPTLRMFEDFLKDFGLKNDECVFIGDDPVIDGSCSKIGIKFILIHYLASNNFDLQILGS